jgi:hypothetical protein
LRIFPQLPLTAVISALLASTLSVFRTRAALQLEILALRHQLGMLQRFSKEAEAESIRPVLVGPGFVEPGPTWRSALRIRQTGIPVIAWHRKGFRLFWTWRVRRGNAAARRCRKYAN